MALATESSRLNLQKFALVVTLVWILAGVLFTAVIFYKRFMVSDYPNLAPVSVGTINFPPQARAVVISPEFASFMIAHHIVSFTCHSLRAENIYQCSFFKRS